MLTVYHIWMISPESHVFIMDGKKPGFYDGQKYGNDLLVRKIRAAKYPMYSSVIEVWVNEE